HRIADEIVDQGAVPEADFGFRRVDVYIDFLCIAFQKQQRERIAGGRHQVVIRRRKSVQQEPVADQASVHEQVNRVPVELLHLRAAHEPAQPETAGQRRLLWFLRKVQLAGTVAQVHQIIQNQAAENLEYALPQRRYRRHAQQLGMVMPQQERLARMRQAIVRHQRGDVRGFGLLRAQKFLAGRNIEKQIANRDGRARGERRFVAAQQFPACELHRRSGLLLGRARLQKQPRYRGDRGQRLAPESQSRDREQILHVRQLAGGVPLECEKRVIPQHAAAVVGQADQLPASGLYLDAKFRRARIERIFQEFLYDARWPFHHLSRRDFVCNGIGEDANSAHRFSSLYELGEFR